MIEADGLLEVADALVCARDAVQRIGLSELVADLSLHPQRLLAAGKTFLGVSQIDAEPSGGVHRPGLPRLVPGRPEQFDSLLSVRERLLVVALPVKNPREAPQDVCLA